MADRPTVNMVVRWDSRSFGGWLVEVTGSPLAPDDHLQPSAELDIEGVLVGAILPTNEPGRVHIQLIEARGETPLPMHEALRRLMEALVKVDG